MDMPSPLVGKRVVGILPGEGIGTEVLGAVSDVFDQLFVRSEQGVEIRWESELPTATADGSLSLESLRFCESVFHEGGAILCGPLGGRQVYEMRKAFDLFCKFTPVCPSLALLDTGALRPETRREVNLVVVRENAGGIYFGDWHYQRGDPLGGKAVHSFQYTEEEVTRIILVALRAAERRSGGLTLIVKSGGLPAISELWIDVFDECVRGKSLSTRILDADNATYQILASACEFDVIVSPNLFGDILSDATALLLGSRGLSFSGNFSESGVAVYQTGHGAAHNIAGNDIANPIGQVLAAAMMLRESFGMLEEADIIEGAIEKTLRSGIRTADIASADSTIVGTREMGRRIARAVANFPSTPST
jgi:3-isopropylmalate dehydrogenase